MKKFFIILPIFVLFQISLVFGETLLDYCPEQALACLNFNSTFASEYFGQKGKNNAVSKAFDEVVSNIKKRFSLDIEKDVDRYAVFFFAGGNGVENFTVISGKFNIKQLFSTSESFIAKAKNPNLKLDSVNFNGKNCKAFKDGKSIIIFYSDNIVFFCNEPIFNSFAQKKITFAKAPKIVAETMKDKKAFAYFSKSSTNMLSSTLNLPVDTLKNTNSIIGSIENDVLTVKLEMNNSNNAEQTKSMLNDFKIHIEETYSKEFENNKNRLKGDDISNLTETIANMYSTAKSKELIDSLNIEMKDNNVVISTKIEQNRLVFGIVGIVVSWFKFNSTEMTQSARAKACFSNQRVLQGAVEMYNLDNEVMMTTLDIPKLVEGRYIKSFKGPEPQCSYESVGDLSGDGYVTCVFHGSAFKQH